MGTSPNPLLLRAMIGVQNGLIRLVRRAQCKALHACAAGLALIAGGCDKPSSPPVVSNVNAVANNAPAPSAAAAMISIPAGEFTMGSDDGAVDSKPAHRVKVNSFLMDAHEVTQELYE